MMEELALADAILCGERSPERLEELVASVERADALERPVYGMRLLHVAAGQGCLPALRALLRAGADRSARADGLTPLQLAEAWGHAHAVTMLTSLNTLVPLPHLNYATKTTLAHREYRDDDAGVTLLETTSVASLDSTERLKLELERHGVRYGPITAATKRVYLRRLLRLNKDPAPPPRSAAYSAEMERSFRDPHWCDDLRPYASLEKRLVERFETPLSQRGWREGALKSSFTYLLLDPRVTDDMPCRANATPPPQLWKSFVESVFYVGKGKRSRPYSHLYGAVGVFKSGQTAPRDQKTRHILDIWNRGMGVVCLHVFQNVIPAEAYTREAAMIDVIGLKNLKNVKPGNYYGAASTWSSKERNKLGLYLLYRAMLIFLNEGERQLRPLDI